MAAADMNQIAAAIEGLQDTPRGGQQARQAHATYGMAWYTRAGSSTASSTDSELEAPGLVASVDFSTGAKAPRIENGGIQLPYANYGLGNTPPNAGGVLGIRYGSGIDAPRINGGMIELVPDSGGGGGECSCVLAQYNVSGVDDVAGKIAGVQFSSGIDEPRISGGMIDLPLAEYEHTGSTVDDAGHAGGVLGICYGSGIDAPRISGGMIELIEPTIEQYSATVPEDGAEGWVLSAYMPMIMASDGSGDLLVSFRQLMRIYNGRLQVNFQRAVAPTGAWENYFNS